MTDDRGSAHVGAMRVEVHLPGVASLKGKRAILNKAKAALRRDLDVSVAEVGWTESWQRSALAVAVVAGSAAGVDRVLDRVVAVLERDPRVVVTGTATDVGLLDVDDLDATAGLLAHGSWPHDEEGE